MRPREGRRNPDGKGIAGIRDDRGESNRSLEETDLGGVEEAADQKSVDLGEYDPRAFDKSQRRRVSRDCAHLPGAAPSQLPSPRADVATREHERKRTSEGISARTAHQSTHGAATEQHDDDAEAEFERALGQRM